MAAVYPSDHAKGAVATFTECTERTNMNKRHAMEIILVKFNAKASNFHNTIDPILGATDLGIDFESMNDFGVILLECYHEASYYVPIGKPQGAITVIPDFNRTEYTEYGGNEFSGASDGASKSNNTPNHGQELYDISGGVYGRDSVSGYGTNNGNELRTLIAFEKNLLRSSNKAFHVLHSAIQKGLIMILRADNNIFY